MSLFTQVVSGFIHAFLVDGLRMPRLQPTRDGLVEKMPLVMACNAMIGDVDKKELQQEIKQCDELLPGTWSKRSVLFLVPSPRI